MQDHLQLTSLIEREPGLVPFEADVSHLTSSDTMPYS